MQYTLRVPSLEQYTHPGVEYYLPDGIVGLRNAVSLALQHCKTEKEKRGRRKIESRRTLADEIWRIWKAYQPKASQEIWQRDDDCSLALGFARVVFEKVYGKMDLYSLAELMKECDKYKDRPAIAVKHLSVCPVYIRPNNRASMSLPVRSQPVSECLGVQSIFTTIHRLRYATNLPRFDMRVLPLP